MGEGPASRSSPAANGRSLPRVCQTALGSKVELKSHRRSCSKPLASLERLRIRGVLTYLASASQSKQAVSQCRSEASVM